MLDEQRVQQRLLADQRHGQPEWDSVEHEHGDEPMEDFDGRGVQPTRPSSMTSQSINLAVLFIFVLTEMSMSVAGTMCCIFYPLVYVFIAAVLRPMIDRHMGT